MGVLQNSSKETNESGKILKGENKCTSYNRNEKFTDYFNTINTLENQMNGLKSFFETIPIGILIVDEDKIIIDVNQVLKEKTEKSKEDFVGKKAGEGLGCYNSSSKGCGESKACSICPLKSTIESVFSNRKPLSGIEINSYFIVKNNIVNQWARIHASCFEVNKKKYAAIMMEDIYKEKRNIHLENRLIESEKKLIEMIKHDRKRNEFFANVTHEFKTPLNIILSSIQLLNDLNAGNEALLRYNKIMKQNCYRLLKLINNLIDIAKIESGFFDLNIRNQNIVAIVEETTLSTVEYAKAKGIRLIFDTEIEEKIVACDAEKIERIILNLLSNAIKYTKVNGIIQVRICEKDDCILISVKDSGIGIPSEMSNEIFKIFRQVDPSFKRNNEGSGIGLFIVKTIVDLHGGKLKINSKEGEGSEFVIEIPTRFLSEDDKEEGYTYEHNKEKSTIEFSNIK